MNKSMKAAIALGLIAVIAVGYLIVYQPKAAAAYAEAKEAERVEREQEIVKRDTLAEAEKLFKGYYYDEAIDLLQSNPAIITVATDDAITLKIEEIEKAKASLVKYEGAIEHVFFHSLIVYPELAFDNKGHPAQGYNMVDDNGQ